MAVARATVRRSGRVGRGLRRAAGLRAGAAPGAAGGALPGSSVPEMDTTLTK